MACDTPPALDDLRRAAEILAGIPTRKLRCYVLVGFGGESIRDAERRLEAVYGLGFLPFCQLYQGEKKTRYSKDWRALVKKWSRPGAYRRKGSEIR